MSHHSSPLPLAVNAAVMLPEGTKSVALFLPITAGTITLTTLSGKVVLNAFPVSAGVWVPMHIYVGNEATVTLAGGASGTLLLN